MVDPQATVPPSRRARVGRGTRQFFRIVAGVAVAIVIGVVVQSWPLITHQGTLVVDRDGCSAEVFNGSVAGKQINGPPLRSVATGSTPTRFTLPAGEYSVLFGCSAVGLGGFEVVTVASGVTSYAYPSEGPVDT